MENRSDFEIRGGTLIKYHGPGGHVTIPDGVTCIGKSAFLSPFDDPNGITSVFIPDGVTEIGDEAFSFCRSLVTVRIPESVREIGRDAFYYCVSLRNVICYTPYVVSRIPAYKTVDNIILIYLRGRLSELPEEYRTYAVKGYIYAMDHGIEEISRWKNGYMDYFRRKKGHMARLAEEDRSVLRFLIREGLLDQKRAEYLLDHFVKEGDLEAKALLMKYCYEKFGSEGQGDLSI